MKKKFLKMELMFLKKIAFFYRLYHTPDPTFYYPDRFDRPRKNF